MHLTRYEHGVRYQPPFHEHVDARRLQGLEAGPCDAFWVGISQYPPGSSAGPSEVMAETVYVILDGTLTLDCEGRHVLGRHDSVRFQAGEHRTLVNESEADATLLVVIAK